MFLLIIIKILLKFFSQLVHHDPLYEYFSSLPAISYFAYIAMRLHTLSLKLNDEILSDDHQLLKNVHDDLVDDILFLQDIFSLKIPRITYILTNSLFYYFIMPMLCGSLISMQKPRLGTSVVLYIFLAFFYFIKEESFLNTLFLTLFEENVNEALKNFISEEPEFPQNFFFEWNVQLKEANKKSFFELIKHNFSEAYLQSVIYMSNSPFKEIKNIVVFFEKFNEDSFNSSSFSSVVNKENFMETLKEQVLSNFSHKEIREMQSFHKTLSRATGMNVGFIVEDERKHCFLEVFNEFMKKQEVGLFFLLFVCLFIFLFSNH